MDIIGKFTTKHVPKGRFSNLRVGWTVRVTQKLKEGDKVKSQTFEGIIVARKHGNEAGGTITVRKISGGIGVEKTIPLHLPSIEKITVVKKPRMKRAKLYYLKEKSAKEIRRKTRQEAIVKKIPEQEPAQEQPQEQSQEDKPAAS